MLRFLRAQKRKPYYPAVTSIVSIILAITCVVVFSVGPSVPHRWFWIALCAFYVAIGTFYGVCYIRAKRIDSGSDRE